MSDETVIFEKKFILSVIALSITALMMWCGKIQSGTFENVYVWVCGVFMLGEASVGFAQWFMTNKFASAQKQEST